jgi:uncharacterized protein (DUF2147 family)
MMRLGILAGCAAMIVSTAAPAAEEQTHSNTSGPADPVGEWLVNDQTARIRIESCGGAMWGSVSWEKSPGGRDTQNPDPIKRTRATQGLPVILNMQPSQDGRWNGEVYNAKNGKTYTAQMRMLNPSTLRIEGCVLGFLCGGENWTRSEPKTSAQKSTFVDGHQLDVCSSISDNRSRPR